MRADAKGRLSQMVDITAIGELLIDFTPAGQTERGDMLFARIPGGAPANVLAAAAKLGNRTAFLGKVGDDAFGSFLRATLDGLGISTQGLLSDPNVHTTLAFVQLDEHGDRSFSFYRKPGADIMLDFSEVRLDLVEQASILHFGSVSLTDEPSRTATLKTAEHAKKLGKLLSYDPNFRPPLWDSVENAKTQMLRGLALADIVKVSGEELELLSGTDDLERSSAILAEKGPSLILVSLGAQGAFYRLGSLTGFQPTYDVKTIDTNGAGDSFFGAVLHRLAGKSLEEIRALSRDELEDILAYGNAAGSLTTTRKGSIPALPTEAEIEECRRTVPLLQA